MIEKRLGDSPQPLIFFFCRHNLPSESCLPYIDFFQQAVGMSPAVHQVKHVAHVDIDGTSQLTVEEDVAGQ